MEDLGLFQPPDPDYFAQHPDHLWDAGRLEMDLDDIFTTLPRRFNFMRIPILDRDAFRLEASHAASIARDRAEFYELLKSRLEARRKEQIKMMMRALSHLAIDPEQMELPDRAVRHWTHAMHVARSKSFDTIVRFLAGFLRDEDPCADIATLAAGQDDHSKREPDATSPNESRDNGPSVPPPEIFSRRRFSSDFTAEKSRTSSLASSPTEAGNRKRLLTPATESPDNEQDEDEMRPTKKIRFAYNIVKPRAATSPRRRLSPRPRRAQKGQPTVPQLPRSTVPPTMMAPSALAGSQPSANETIGGDSSKRSGSASMSQQIHSGNSGQHVVHPDAKDEGDNRTRAKHNQGPAAGATTRPEPHQGSRRLRPLCKGKTQARQPPPSSPRSKPTGKIQKPTTRPDRRAPKTTAQGSRGTGAVPQTRASQRLTRRCGQAGQCFHELDSHGKARLVVA